MKREKKMHPNLRSKEQSKYGSECKCATKSNRNWFFPLSSSLFDRIARIIVGFSWTQREIQRHYVLTHKNRNERKKPAVLHCTQLIHVFFYCSFFFLFFHFFAPANSQSFKSFGFEKKIHQAKNAKKPKKKPEGTMKQNA